MQLNVSHTTTYRFEPPRARVVQSLRMTPVQNASQNPVSWSLSIDGARLGASFRDGAGDLIQTMSVPGPVEEIAVVVTGEVLTTDTAGVLRGHKETIAPAVYLRETRHTAPGIALHALSEKLGGGQAGSLESAHELANLVADEITYTPGSTKAGMSVSEVVELGAGVCQDQTQVLIALARLRGMPARYVHGYLYAQAEDMIGEAGHAWAELYVDGLGWIGFDPANRCCPDERYIRVGSGLDALEAAPIRGISLGGGEESIDIQVSVASQSQSQTQQ